MENAKGLLTLRILDYKFWLYWNERYWWHNDAKSADRQNINFEEKYTGYTGYQDTFRSPKAVIKSLFHLSFHRGEQGMVLHYEGAVVIFKKSTVKKSPVLLKYLYLT